MLNVAKHFTGLHRLAGFVSIEEHNVVRIDHVHGQEPGLSLGRQLSTAAAEPANAH